MRQQVEEKWSIKKYNSNEQHTRRTQVVSPYNLLLKVGDFLSCIAAQTGPVRGRRRAILCVCLTNSNPLGHTEGA
jgi:hypothetical protein